jgi:hypothetical protein
VGSGASPDTVRRVVLQELPDLEQRAAAGVEDLKSRRVNGSGPAGHDHCSQDDDDALFLQLHTAQLDVLAPTHRGAYIGAEILNENAHEISATKRQFWRPISVRVIICCLCPWSLLR